MTDIAERAGVAATSLYRRWGDIRVLVMEVAVKELIREHPLPNTGRFAETSTSGRETSLKASAAARAPLFFRALIATTMPAGTHETARAAALTPRATQIITMLERARERGEKRRRHPKCWIICSRRFMCARCSAFARRRSFRGKSG
jgi:AcrR family transcriptional regulator